jgi:hypothetical protein
MNTAINMDNFKFDANDMRRLSCKSQTKINEREEQIKACRKLKINEMINNIYKRIEEKAKNGETELSWRPCFTSLGFKKLDEFEIQQIERIFIDKGFKIRSRDLEFSLFWISWKLNKEEKCVCHNCKEL